jgi:2-polyprenyl-3-methyl-5-hydroxy-6-metoxy-1,4-benzoquinol methylase
MVSGNEHKLRYYEWHAADAVTIGEIEQELANCTDVLDLGCGSGWLSIEIARLGVRNVVGVDIDDAVLALNALTLNGAEIRGVQARSEDLPFANDSFDLVIAKDLLEHLPDPSSTTNEIYRILRPGGAVYASAPAPGSRTYFDDYTHVRPFNKKAISALMEDSGFLIERSEYFGSYPGMGRYMRLTHRKRLPMLARILAKAGIGRGNVIVWARKPT